MSCVRGCCADQASHYRSLSWNADRPERAAQRTSDADMDAYARLRRQGAQPRAIDGAAVLERSAESKVEVERGHLIRNDKLRKQVEATTVPS